MPAIRGTSEGSETSKLKYSTTRIQICRVYFCSGIILENILRKGVFQRVYFCLGILLEVVLKKEVKITFTKIDPADLDSLCQELSNSGLKVAITLPVCSGIDFLLACIGRAIQL